MFRRGHTKNLIKNHYRRLEKLKEQQALYGISADPRILIEIENIEAEIEKLQAELEELEKDIATSTSQTPASIIYRAHKKDQEPPLFVGRTAELQQLDRCLTKTITGQPHLVFVSGEAGIGKSSLVGEFIRRAQATYPKLTTAIGYCNSIGGTNPFPFYPFRTIFEQLFLSGDDEDEAIPISVQRLVNAVGSILGFDMEEVFSLSGIAPSKKLLLVEDSTQIRTMFLEQISRLLCWMSQQAPLLLILEDLHWADESTIELLFYLVRDWEVQQLMIVVTYRADEIMAVVPEHLLLQVERELTGCGLCQQIKMAWLDEANLQEWLTQRYSKNQFPADFTRWLYERTHGNALFVNEILKDLQERQRIFQVDGETWTLPSQLQDSSDLPASIMAVLERRLARLEKQLHQLLTCASVEGEKFTAQVIAIIRQLDEDDVINSLIEILDHQLELVSMKDERQTTQRRWLSLFEFRHSLLQMHLYNTLKPPQRRRLHRQVGECLEALYEGMVSEIAPTLARHFTEAGDGKKAFEYALLAAEQAEIVYDCRTSSQWLRVAIDQLPSLKPDPQVQVEIWHRLGQAEALTGSFEEAEICYLRGLEGLEQTQADEKRADLLLSLGYCYIQTARSQEAVALLDEALKINKDLGRPIDIAYAMVYLAFAYHKCARQDLAKDYLLCASKEFKELDDLAGEALVHRHLGINYRIEGDFELSKKHLEQAIQLDRQIGDKFHESSGYTNLGSTYLMLRNDQDQAMACYQKSLELSREISKVHEEGHVLLNIARLFAFRQEWPQALENVEEGLRISNAVQQTSNIIRGHWYRGIIQFHLDHLDEALKDCEQALAIGACDDRTRWALLYNWGSLQLNGGKIIEALAAYREAGKLLLDIAKKISPEKQVKFFQTEQKIYVFLALHESAKRAGQLEEVDSLLNCLPANVPLETDQVLPRFYWGGGKWI